VPRNKITSDVFAGGAPGTRTLHPRIKSRPLGRAARSTCTDATRGRTESTHRTGIRSPVRPTSRPTAAQARPGKSVTVSDGDAQGERAPSRLMDGGSGSVLDAIGRTDQV